MIMKSDLISKNTSIFLFLKKEFIKIVPHKFLVLKIRIIKEGDMTSSRHSLQFFQDYSLELGEIHYIILYYAEREWEAARSPEIYHQYVVIVGEKAQLWMSSLTWGYCGTDPYTIFEIMQSIDPTITYEDITALEWMAEDPIVFEKVNGKLMVAQFDQNIKRILCNGKDSLPWDIMGINFWQGNTLFQIK
jgi:hypothetical protein